MKDFLVKLIKNPYVLNLLLAVVVACALVFGTLKWLDSYTRHNEAVVVPDVKGLGMEEAAEFFKNSNLRYNVIDSVFSKDVKPRCDCRAGPDGRFEGEGRTYRVRHRECAHFADGDQSRKWKTFRSGRLTPFFVPAGLKRSRSNMSPVILKT